MKKNLLFPLLLLCTSLLSFKGDGNKIIQLHTGTYGVCSTGSDAPGSGFSLQLSDDHTFRYINRSDAQKPVDVTGTWTQEGRSVHLAGYPAGSRIHDEWTIDRKNDHCLRSRKGMEFMRLCNCR